MRVPMLKSAIATALVFTLTQSAMAQSRSGGGGTSSFSTSPNGIQQSSLGSGSGFRPNNSTFGSPLNLNTGLGSLGSMTGTGGSTGGDPFAQARTDPQAQGRAVGNLNAGFNRGGLPSFGQGGNRARQAGMQNQFNNGQANRPVRAVVRVAFEPVRVPAETVRAASQSALSSVAIPGGKQVQVLLEEGVATLSGTVGDAHAARLAAAMVALEPGVRSVNNQLQVVAPQ